MKGYLTTKQAGEVLGITPDRVRQLISEGTIKAEKFGRDNFILESEVKRVEKMDRKPGRPSKKSDSIK
ncbi:MAG: helix-turn-helix domain-containing protein [Acidobacteriota bacterium]|jgi:excisionase family DNA binding protein|nr:helix-turn-helix domain-containing protein [Acidobacteriota bacterium]